MRIRGAKTELEEAGLETEGMVESTAKLREEILALSGVDIMESDGRTFKSTYAILDELSQKWKDLSDIQQATVTELIAGKRQGNIISSLMANFDTARDALEVSLNSSGSAMKEHEKWQQSLEAQILKLKASWQSLSQAFLSSDFLKVVFNGVINLVDGFTKLIDTLGTLPTLLTTIATGMSLFKNQGIFKTVTSDLDGWINKVGIAKRSFADLTNAFKVGGLKGFFNSLSSSLTQTDIANIQAYNQAIENGTSAQTAWYQTMQTSSRSAQDLVNAANGGKVALDGMRTASIGAKAGLIGAKIAAVAFNAALTIGISLLIDWAISGIQKLVNAKKDLAERVDEVTSKFKEQSEELRKLKGDYDTSNENSMISKYEKLSKGVDGLGRNVSLTADEYAEYQNIVNQIAEQFPTLISGYDSQGNALLSCKDNVEKLTQAYEDLRRAQNDEILGNSEDIEDDFENVVKDAKSYKDGLFGIKLSTESAKIYKDILNSKDAEGVSNAAEAFDKAVHDYDTWQSGVRLMDSDIGALAELLEENGIERKGTKWNPELDEDYVKRALSENKDAVNRILNDFYADLEAETDGMKSIASALLSNAIDFKDSEYYGLSDTMKNIAQSIVSDFDYEFFEELADKEIDIGTYINDMLGQLNSLDSEHTAEIEAAFDLRTQFNGGEISYGEYVQGLEDTGKLIDELVSSGALDKELGTQIKLSIGLNEDGLVDEYQRLRKRLASEEFFSIMPSEYESFINGLSVEELSVLWKIIPELEATDYKEDINDIKAALEKEMMLQGLTFTLNLEVESAGIEALNTALAESVSATGLSSESIAALKSRYAELEAQGYDLSVLFEETSHGIHLNRQEFNKLEKAYATEKLAKVDSELAEMKDAYDDLGEAIKNTDDPVRKAELYNDRQTLAKKISEAATLASQYEGLTSAYNDWLAAEEAGQERDMYENVIEGFENIGDEISRGWYDDGTIEFLEMLTGRTDLAGKSAKELKKIYDDLDKSIKYVNKDGKVLEDTGYSVRDFFTVDDEGNSTADGVYNFLDAIGKLEEEAFGGKDIVKRDKNGKIIAFDFELAGGDEAIAEALGVSEELVQIMKRAADDAGFVVSLDGTYKQLADLQNEARTAADYLKKIGKTDFEFDFNSTNLTNLNKQLEEAHKILDDPSFWNKDGTFNFNADGATEAMQIVSTLQAKIDQLTEEKYGIGLTVEDEQFEEPLENLQEYGRKVQALNQLKLNPKANAEEIKALEGDLEEISKYFANLDEDLKVELGFEADDNWEEVQKKIESGEVTIPTVLDIQANIDKNIEKLVGLSMLNSNLYTEEEKEIIKKQYGLEVEVKAEKVDTSDVDDKVNDSLGIGGGAGVAGRVIGSVAGAVREAHIQIIADTLGIEDVDDLSSKLEGLDDKTIQAIAEVLGQIDVEKLQQAMALIEPKKVEAIAEAIGKGDVDGLRSAIKQLDPKTVQAIAEALGYSDVNELDNAIAGMDGNTVQAIAQALGLGDVNTLQITINNMQGNTVDAKVNTDGQSGKIDTLQSKIDGMHGKTIDIVINTIKNVVSKVAKGGKKKAGQRTGSDPAGNDSDVNGTANVNGTVGRAYKQGSWGTKDSGTALVGELGREVLVRDGKYYTIGDNGAEFIKYKQGDIIFNHKQAEELFRNGRVTADGGRARAFVQGTAFDEGTGGGEYGGKSVGTNNEEVFDWIETLISRLERTIDNLDQTIKNVHKSWSDRNDALKNEISEVGNLISAQESAYNAYMTEANKVGLDESWAEKVRNGTIDIDTITDENLAEKIKEYQEWYEKSLAAKDAVEELKETEAELYAQRFENVQSAYDGILQGFEHTESMIDEYINQAEAKGHIVSQNYYQALIDNKKAEIDTLEKEQSVLLSKRKEYYNAMIAQGMTDEEIRNSEQWQDMCSDIDDVTQAIEEGNTALIEYANSIRDIDWEVFDLIQERISDVVDEADFLIELMSNDKLHNDDGSLTDKGMATMGQHAVKYNAYMYQSDEYEKEIAKLDAQIAKDPYDQELINRRNELLELQRESILAAEDEKEAMRDLVEEGINLELDALQELIDKKNEELESEKDLYEYSKKVKEQTEEIASLEKQLAAYSGDNSEEARAKVQELKVSLEEAKTNLEETEYDKYLSDTQEMLDTLYDEYELILNQRLDNVDALLSDMITEINANATTISSTLSAEATNVGTTLSEAMKSIWENDGAAQSVVAEYGTGFQGKQTKTNLTLDAIKDDVARMVDDVDKDATTKIKQPETQSNTKVNLPINKNDNKVNNNKNKIIITNDILKGIAAAIWVYGKDSGWGNNPFREDKLTKKLGASNAKLVQDYVNKDGASGALYNYWIKNGKNLNQYKYKAFKLGAKDIDESQLAWTQENGAEFIVRPSDGAILTPIAKGDSVLTSVASSNIWDMANSPTEFIKDNLNLGATNVPNNANVQNNITQNLDKVVFNLPNVHNYEQLLSEMQKDKNFERLIMSMTIDQIAGKSGLAKNKSIR